MSQQRKAFKDYFDREAAERLAEQIHAVHRGFDSRGFIRGCTRGLDRLEFQDRVRQFSTSLRTTLPEKVPRALKVLTKSLPPALPDCDSVTDGWLQWPVGQFIADHGVPHFDASFEAMIELTQRFSSEFAVRPFVDQQPGQTITRLLELVHHESPHVRRWCSEGTRPRLPWGKRLDGLVDDPGPIFPILEALKDDPELYVRRSVANNLNDIAKDHPKMVIKRCRTWSRGASEERSWVIRQSLRTLVKAGDPGALKIVGFGPPRSLEISFRLEPPAIRLGESVELHASLTNRSAKKQKILVDYVLHLVRKAGRTSEKVFKWTQVDLAPGASIELVKRHAMKETTIRALYSGSHRVEIQLNGHRMADAVFQFSAP